MVEKNGNHDAPIVVSLGNIILDYGMAADLPKALLWFYRHLRYQDDQLKDQEAMPLVMMISLKDGENGYGLRLTDLPAVASDKSLERYQAKWRRMGLVFTKREFYTYEEMRQHFRDNVPPNPRLKHVVWDLTNLMYNVALVAQERSERNLERIAEWEREGKKGIRPTYTLPADYVHEMVLSPEVAQRIVDDEYTTEYVPDHWKERAQQIVNHEAPQIGGVRDSGAVNPPNLGESVDLNPPKLGGSVAPKSPSLGESAGLNPLNLGGSLRSEEEKEEEGHDRISLVLARFAEQKGDPAYQPNDRELDQVQQLIEEGYSTQQIIQAVNDAFDSRRPDADPIRRFGYVVGFIHHRLQPTEAQPTEVTDHTDGQPTGAQSTGVQAGMGNDAPLAQVHVLLQAAEHDEIRYDVPAIRLGLQHFLRGEDPFTADEIYEAVTAAVVRNILPERLIGYTEAVLHDKRAEARARERLHRQTEATTRAELASRYLPDQLPLLDDPHAVQPTTRSEAASRWKAALAELELQMTRSTFTTWVKPLVAVSLEEDTLTLDAPNEYIQDWVMNRLHTPIARTISGIVGRPIKLVVTVGRESET
jgi:hypothetical protein